MNSKKFTEAYGIVRSHLQKAGICIFGASVLIFTQLNWARTRHNYNAFKIRIILAIVAGFILSYPAVAFIKRAARKKGELYVNALIEDISLAASFGLLFIFGSASKAFIYLSLAGSVFILIYKRNPTARNAINFAANKMKKFIKILLIEQAFGAVIEMDDKKATIIFKGNFLHNDSDYLRFFTSNLIDQFKECIEKKAQEVKINLSRLKGGREEIIKPIADSISRYFGIKIKWGK
jgi:hypothetical protein